MAGYVPVRGKESRVQQLRRIAAEFEQGRLPAPNGRAVAESLRETADRLSKKLEK